MEDILNIGVSEKNLRKLVVQNITKKLVNVPNRGRAEKIVLRVKEPKTNREFNISDAWVKDSEGELTISGLWFTEVEGGISKNSTLAKVLEYYDANVLGDLLSITIKASPDQKNYLVLTACDM